MLRDRTLGPLRRRGFTLIELMVVILIIALVSVVALPTIVAAFGARQMSEGARILQGALVGARDQAIHDNQAAGIRLLPDPAFNGINPATGLFDPTMPLAYNRVVPIGQAPDYSEGRCIPYTAGNIAALGSTLTANLPSPFRPCLILLSCPTDPANGTPNPPTNWYWNVRVGDKVQIGNAGPWYTVIGPSPAMLSTSMSNPEWFVNEGAPGAGLATSFAITATDPATGKTTTTPLEFLALVNGKDDNGNGWTDETWDGIDNNGEGNVDEYLPGQMTSVTYTKLDGTTVTMTIERTEWEGEAWHGALLTSNTLNVPYTIRRRPAPVQGAREIALPTQVVIDATTWGSTQERSRLPVNAFNNGLVDIMVNPDGSAYHVLLYGTPSSTQLGGSFYHFWLADRQDVMAPTGTTVPTLPIVRPGGADASYAGPTLKGDYGVVTLSGRTGITTTNLLPRFDDPLSPLSSNGYNQALPFIPAEQGVANP